MAIYSVVFDLLLPQEYEAFFNQLQAYPCKHVADTCYLVETEISSDLLRDKLMPLMGVEIASSLPAYVMTGPAPARNVARG